MLRLKTARHLSQTPFESLAHLRAARSDCAICLKREVEAATLLDSNKEEFMIKKYAFAALTILGALFLLFPEHFRGAGQAKIQPEEYQAQAMGQGTQLGQMFNVTLHIEEYSSPEERQVLIEAFEKAGSQGLYNTLCKMHAKGRIAITGTLGYDVVFARVIAMPEGKKIRVLTNRPITFGEAWTDSRSMDYNLSALELDINSEMGKSAGILLPACQFKINKKTNELEIEQYQNPWKLVDIQDRSKR